MPHEPDAEMPAMASSDHDPRAIAAAQYALAIRSKRDLLQTLYYATKTGAADAYAFQLRLNAMLLERPGGGYAIQAGNIMPRHELINSKTAAEATAQDSAWAFVIIVDYSLQRLRTAVPEIDTRDIGPDILNGVNLNAAIWAFANQARHLHAWQSRDTVKLEAQDECKIIRQLRYDPLDPNAAREFLCWIPAGAYVDIEDWLIAGARIIMQRFGSVLSMISAGTFLLEKLRARAP